MAIPDQQQETGDFLAKLCGRAPHETHISAVFIGGDTAFKLKKAVRLPYLDFTAAESRRHFLLREMELNRPAAPEIYRDVVAVVRGGDGALALAADPAGAEVVDWVLRMAPISPGDFLDAIAQRGRLAPDMLDRLGDMVAAYHARLAAVAGRDSPRTLLGIAAQAENAAIKAGLAESRVRDWHARLSAGIAHLAPCLATRAAQGLVRRGHGDLHLGNICLWRQLPVPFDALEFNEDLATTDIGYDLAFLVMDLDCRVDRAAANRVFNRYVGQTGDAGLAVAMSVFLSLRAAIRAFVQAQRGLREEAMAYLDAAERHLRPAHPGVLAIGGLQGTGKSTLARTIAPELGGGCGALVLRSDETRKRLHGVRPEEKLPAAAYGPEDNARTDQALLDAVRAAAAGATVIVDATFRDAEMRRGVAEIAESRGVTFAGIWLEAPVPVLEARIRARHGDASDATVDVLHEALRTHRRPEGWHAVDSENFETALATIREIAVHR